MFINAKSALIDAGAHARWMPFEVTVQYKRDEHGEWINEAKGHSTDYLAEVYTDLRNLWHNRVRMINSANGVVIYRG